MSCFPTQVPVAGRVCVGLTGGVEEESLTVAEHPHHNLPH